MFKSSKKLIIFLSILALAGGFVLAVNKYKTNSTRGNQPRVVFEEIRQWQVASDANLTYVGGAENSGNSDSFNVAFTALEGDLVIVSTGFVSTSDGDPGVSTAGYAEVADLYVSDNRDANFSVNWKIMVDPPDTSVTCNGSGSTSNGAVAVVHVWRGADPDNPMDVTPTTATGASNSAPDSPSITPITSETVVIATGLGTSSAVDDAVTAPAGYGNQVDISVDPGLAVTVGISSKVWTSGAEDPAVWTNWTNANQDSWGAVTLAIRPLVTLITISGTVYTDEAKSVTVSNGTSVGLSIQGGAKKTTTTTDGIFSFSEAVSANDTITLFIDTNYVGNLVTQAIDDVTDITGLEMYTNKVVLRDEIPTTGEMTNDLLDIANNLGDADLLFTVVSSNADFTGTAGIEVWVESGHNYTPGGTVTAEDFEVSGTSVFEPAGNAVTIEGNWKFSATGTFTTSGTVTFNGAVAQTITGVTTWNNLTINNTYATPDDTYDVDPGAIQTVAGTLTVTDGQWSPYDGDDYVDVSIGSLGIMKPDANITVSGDWTNSGTFTHNSGTVTFDGNASSNQTVTTNGQAFYDFTANNDEVTYDDIIISGALDINNTLTVTDGDLKFDTNNPNVNTAGDVTIGASGTVTKGTGTWTFDGSSQVITDSTASTQDLGIITIGPSTTTSVSTASATKVTNLTIGADDTFDITGDTLTITGNGTPLVITSGGTFTTTSSTVKYTSSSDTYITQTEYYDLKLGPGL